MILSLENTSMEELHSAFVDAFSTYEVKMEFSQEELEATLKTRSYNASYSRGFFDGDKLAGFLLVGFREEAGEKLFYDCATGIRQEYQRQGIGKALLKAVQDLMNDEGIDSFVLEVLENNEAARELYAQNGFSVKRNFACYDHELGKNKYDKIPGLKVIENKEPCPEAETYCSFKPSWQNANPSYLNSMAQHEKLDFNKDDVFAGYMIINRENGNIIQLGLANEFRQVDLLAGLMVLLKEDYTLSTIKFLNIEEASPIDELLKAFGMRRFIGQYEMVFKNRS